MLRALVLALRAFSRAKRWVRCRIYGHEARCYVHPQPGGWSRPWCAYCASYVTSGPVTDDVGEVPFEDGRHVTGVQVLAQRWRPASTSRRALCSCGWKGPQRGTMELAADDALLHEQSEYCVSKRLRPIAPVERPALTIVRPESRT